MRESVGAFKIRKALILVAAALGLPGAVSSAFAQDAPLPRVMTLNMCADQLVLALLPPERITSVTYISHRSSDSDLAAKAARVGINFGQAEEVFEQAPDLVITGEFSTPAVRAVLRRADYPLYEMPNADNFNAIRDNTRKLAALLGVSARGEELIAEMDATLAALARAAPRTPITVVAWDGSGLSPGKGTLFDEILRAAGGVNLATSVSDAPLVSFDMEELLAARPDLIAYGDAYLDTPSLRYAPLKHPAIESLYRNRQIRYPETRYVCGLPQAAEAALSLRAAMTEAMADPLARAGEE